MKQEQKAYQVVGRVSSMRPDEWLAIRKKSIGGSEIAAAVGLSRWKTPFQLFAEKTGLIKPDNKQTEAMYWGTVLEAIIREEFTKRTGYEVTKPDFIFAAANYSFLTANLDGIIDFGNGEYGVLEIKTSNGYSESDWADDGCPVEYFLQVQHYLYVTGLKRGYIAVLIGGSNFRLIEIQREDNVIQKIEGLAVDFWTNHVMTGKAPAVMADDVSALSMLYPQSRPKSAVVLTEDFNGVVAEYQLAKNQVDEAKKRKESAEVKLKEAMKDNEEAVVGAFKITWKTTKRTTLSVDKVKALLTPDMMEACTVISTSRTFRVTKIKK